MSEWIARIDGGGRGRAQEKCPDWPAAANWLRGMLDAAMPETDALKPTATYDAAVKTLAAAEPGAALTIMAGAFVLTLKAAP